MNTDGKIKVLFITDKAHLYGDNKSLLTTLCSLDSSVERLVCVTQLGLFTDELSAAHIPFQLIEGTMTPLFMPISLKHKWLHKLLNYPIYIRKKIKTRKQLSQIIRNYQPDIIHSNNGFIYAGAIMSEQYSIPHVWHLREYITLDHNTTIPSPRFFSKARKKSHCIAITRGLFEHWELTTPKDTHIYNGMFQAKSIPEYQEEKGKNFLFLGRILKTKGIEELLQAFSEFAKTNTTFKLRIVGDGEEAYVKNLKDILRQNHIEDRVEFAGFHKDVRPYLQSAYALIVPSKFEAMGRITAEAMMLGCLVIGRNTGGTKELLEYEQAGLLYDDTEGLTKAMSTVANYDELQLKERNLRARSTALAHYSAENNAKQVYEFYKSILNLC